MSPEAKDVITSKKIFRKFMHFPEYMVLSQSKNRMIVRFTQNAIHKILSVVRYCINSLLYIYLNFVMDKHA